MNPKQKNNKKSKQDQTQPKNQFSKVNSWTLIL